MHWTDDELRALYHLAAELPRDWVRIADAMRRRYPDRRPYTVGCIQQKYNEAVRVPVWSGDELDALRKYGMQFPGQWDRITQLMRATFGDGRRAYIGEILERKWKRMRHDDGSRAPADSDADSEVPSWTTPSRGAQMSSPPGLLSAAVPLWPVNQEVRPSVTAEMNDSPSLTSPPVCPPARPVPVDTVPRLEDVAAAPVAIPLPPPEPESQASPADRDDTLPSTDGEFVPALQLPAAVAKPEAPAAASADPVHVAAAAALNAEADDPFRFNPEEAAEILADFGCQFVNEVEQALTRPASPTMTAAGVPETPPLPSPVQYRELSAAAVLSGHRPDPDDMDEVQHDAADRDELVTETQDHVTETKDDVTQEAEAPLRPSDRGSSSDSDADSDSKAPISSRIQRRRQSKDQQQQKQPPQPPQSPLQQPQVAAPESDSGRARRRPKSLDGGAAASRPRPKRRSVVAAWRRLDVHSDNSAAPPLRPSSADTVETEETRLRRKRSRDSTASRAADSESEEAAPRRTRRFSDPEVTGRRSRRKSAAVSAARVPDMRRQAVWTEDEERALAGLRRELGNDWERIGAALQTRFPDLRLYSVVSVRCKWKHMVRHEHTLAFESSESEADEKSMEIETKAVVVRNDEDDDDGMAVCDADAAESVPDAVGVVVVSVESSLFRQLLLRAKSDPDSDRRLLPSSQLQPTSDDDLAVCDI